MFAIIFTCFKKVGTFVGGVGTFYLSLQRQILIQSVMATFTYSLSVKSTKNGNSEIIVRFRHATNGKGIDKQALSGIFIDKDYFKDGKIFLSSKRLLNDENKALKEDLEQAEDELKELSKHITNTFLQLKKADKDLKNLHKDWLKDTIKDFHHPKPTEEELKAAEEEPETEQKKTFLEIFAEYIDSEDKDISDGNRLHYKALWRLLKRYEIINGTTLDFDTLTPETIRNIQKYMRKEHEYFSIPNARTKKAMAEAPESRMPKKRGENTIIILTKKLRAFVRWANGLDRNYKLNNPYTHNNPFDSFSIGGEQYGTPYYLTIEERNKLFDAVLPERLARQRDIFVFQCCIGCRVSDLWAMTRKNIVDGAIEYVPQKTQKESSERIRVPLNSKAMEILERYKDCGGRLFPFVAKQQYNEDIKEMLKQAGIDRVVTVRNPLTGKPEQRPIYEVASSHMARRTFVGNLYKQVKDPNLIGSLSGHVEGSRAFTRYREIDEETKKELVSLLD